MTRDAEARFVYLLASRLGKTVGEVLDLPAEELRGWSAFLSWEAAQK